MNTEQIPESWRAALDPALQAVEAHKLGGWLRAEEEAGKTIYPPRGQRLAALAATPLNNVRVVILGQDPYHGPGQAHGLAFSVADGVKPPPSLANIFKELSHDLDIPIPQTGNLTPWAKQGVLLLNNTLTVEAAQAGSHAGRGWDAITDAAVQAVAQSDAPTVFVLWGSHAAKKASRVKALGARAVKSAHPRHLILNAPHPSPLSAYRGFFGSRPFSQANAFLLSHGRSPIDWSL
ncbi:uracil-DNA glycosylase [Erythrobacter sp. Alg231-14]|uniref:uracil-DNA glycosylase n=1 Tax=Erythrobacter sp. Alg231-14 TaxID=1922225 RepID=UPI000D54C2C3